MKQPFGEEGLSMMFVCNVNYIFQSSMLLSLIELCELTAGGCPSSLS